MHYSWGSLEQEGDATQGGRPGNQVGPPVGKGYGSFEADQSAKEGRDHKNPMRTGVGGGNGCLGPSQSQQAGESADNQRDNTDGEEGKAPAGLKIGCS
tara:strand:- start:62483 stop:62776 length:294 start_codon:yes stop_codon:yes gene_type:complete